MMVLWVLSVFVFIISLVILFLPFFLKGMYLKIDFQTPFECGFLPMGSGSSSFSIRFFLLTVIFLIFDVEIALLLPMLNMEFSLNPMFWIMLNLLFFLILFLGTYMEWKNKALDWKF